jgi:hypothetical protein
VTAGVAAGAAVGWDVAAGAAVTVLAGAGVAMGSGAGVGAAATAAGAGVGGDVSAAFWARTGIHISESATIDTSGADTRARRIGLNRFMGVLLDSAFDGW